ncbi:MAG: metallophosphoesterase family protein, partial [Chloroflexi bacterium]|nr:metallophosphoesterase family protein [Chloroflexota bacterium]
YDPRIKLRQFLEVEGYRLGMTHIIEGWEFGVEKMVRYYLGEMPEIVVCGDTHYEFVRRQDGLLIVNPGSPTYPHNRETSLGHVAILEVARGRPPEAWIVDLNTLAAPPDGAEPRPS